MTHPDSSNPSTMTRRSVAQWSLGSLAAAALFGQASASQAAVEGDPSLKHFDDVEPLVFPWGWIRWLMNSEIDPDAEMTLGIVEISPNQANPIHQHPNSAEYLYVIAGSCEHRVGDQWIALKAGDTLRIPRGITHAARTGDQPCRVLVVYNTGSRQMVVVEDSETHRTR